MFVLRHGVFLIKLGEEIWIKFHLASKYDKIAFMSAPKRISILGSTGSIGTQCLEVARWQGYRVEALAAGTNTALLLEQVHNFRPAFVSCAEECQAQLRQVLPSLGFKANVTESLAATIVIAPKHGAFLSGGYSHILQQRNCAVSCSTTSSAEVSKDTLSGVRLAGILVSSPGRQENFLSSDRC